MENNDQQQQQPTSNESADDQQQDPTLNESSDDFSKGIVFYLRDDIIVGIVMWNVFNKMALARQV